MRIAVWREEGWIGGVGGAILFAVGFLDVWNGVVVVG